MSTGETAEVAFILKTLSGELDTLYRAIVCREAETGGVEVVLSHCNAYFLALEDHRQNLLDKLEPTTVDSELAQIVGAVNGKLRASREALGSLREVLADRDASTGSKRVPRDFEKRHSAAELTIENILPMIKGIARELGGTSGPQAQPRRKRGRSEGIGEPGREHHQASWDPHEWRRFG